MNGTLSKDQNGFIEASGFFKNDDCTLQKGVF